MDCILGDGRDVEVRGRTRSVMKVQREYQYCQVKYGTQNISDESFRFNCTPLKLLEYLSAGGAVIFVCLTSNNNAEFSDIIRIMGAYLFNPSDEEHLRVALRSNLDMGGIHVRPLSKRNSPAKSYTVGHNRNYPRFCPVEELIY